MNPYAAAWTIGAVIGAILSVVLLVESELDRRSLEAGDRAGRAHTFGRMAQEGIRLSVHIPFALIGFLALDSPVSPEGAGITLVLLYGNVAFIFNSLIAFAVRRAVGRTWAQTMAAAAEVAAAKLLDTAEVAAERLSGVADDTAVKLGTAADLAERTAAATERTADNTERAP